MTVEDEWFPDRRGRGGGPRAARRRIGLGGLHGIAGRGGAGQREPALRSWTPGRTATAARCCAARTRVRLPGHGWAGDPAGREAEPLLQWAASSTWADGHHVDDAADRLYVTSASANERFPIATLKRPSAISRPWNPSATGWHRDGGPARAQVAEETIARGVRYLADGTRRRCRSPAELLASGRRSWDRTGAGGGAPPKSRHRVLHER